MSETRERKWDCTETESGQAVYVAHPDAPPVVLTVLDGKIEMHRIQFKQPESS